MKIDKEEQLKKCKIIADDIMQIEMELILKKEEFKREAKHLNISELRKII